MPIQCLEPLRPIRRFFRTFFAMGAALTFLTLPSTGMMGAEPKAPAVRLVVDYGDGAQVHFTALPWRDGMTVLDALNAAQAHPHGITFTQKGSGSGAMITKIGDLKNEGGGQNSKNWMYYLNDKAGEVGAGSQRLKPMDAVLWKFEVYEYNS
jgi:hypothetical protein